MRLIYLCQDQIFPQIWAVDMNNAQESIKLRMVFDVMFMGDSLTIAITDTNNRLMVNNKLNILVSYRKILLKDGGSHCFRLFCFEGNWSFNPMKAHNVETEKTVEKFA